MDLMNSVCKPISMGEGRFRKVRGFVKVKREQMTAGTIALYQSP